MERPRRFPAREGGGSAMRVLVLMVAFGSVLAGCARVAVTNDEAGRIRAPGVQYYAGRPFVLATKESGGAVTLKVVTIPDTSRPYCVTQGPGLGTGGFIISMIDDGYTGALTSFDQ